MGGNQVGSSGRIVDVLNCWAVFLGLGVHSCLFQFPYSQGLFVALSRYLSCSTTLCSLPSFSFSKPPHHYLTFHYILAVLWHLGCKFIWARPKMCQINAVLRFLSGSFTGSFVTLFLSTGYQHGLFKEYLFGQLLFSITWNDIGCCDGVEQC